MIWFVLNVLALAMLGSVVLYLIPFVVAAQWTRPAPAPRPDVWPRLAVLIPAYREDAVIVDTARRAAEHAYAGRFDVVVIADSLQPDTLDALAALPVTMQEVSFANSTKTKAVRASLNRLPEDAHDAILILDADNVMAEGCLDAIGATLADGFDVVQGRRIAKNLDTGLAQLDGFSEAINNFIFRRGHAAIGLSASLVGSAMAFDAAHLRRTLHAPAVRDAARAVGGFDKKLALPLLYDGHAVAYAEDAVVYDEKVSKSADFVTQRTRWIAAQSQYLRRHLATGLRCVLRGERLDYVNATVHMLLPPRSLVFGALWGGAVVNAIIGTYGLTLAWAAVGTAMGLVFYLAIPPDRDDLNLVEGLWHLPRGLALMGRAVYHGLGAVQTYLHTPHRAVENPDDPDTDAT